MPLLRLRLPAVLSAGVLLPCLVLACGKYPLDLDVYRHGGMAVQHGTALYGVRLGRYGFTYPPFAALCMTSVGEMSLPVATCLATVVSLVALWLVLRWTCGGLLVQPGTYAVVVLVGLIASSPVRETLWNGQVNLVLMALVLADVLRVTPPWCRGALVGVAAAVKLTPAMFVVYLVLRRRRADALRATTAFLLATSAAALVLPGDSARFWTREVFTGSGIGDLARVSNQSLNGVVLRGSGSVGVWLLMVVLVVIVGLALAVLASRDGAEGLAAGAVGIVGCLISPLSWSHHWVWVVPCLGGLATLARSSASRRLIVLSCLVFFVGPVEVPSALTTALPPGTDVLAWILANSFVLTAVAAGLVLGVRLRNARLGEVQRTLNANAPRGSRTGAGLLRGHQRPPLR